MGVQWGQEALSGGVFARRDLAEFWITKNRLTGTLTLYPVDIGAYEWAIGKGYFRPGKRHESEPEFIGGFPLPKWSTTIMRTANVRVTDR